MLKFEQIIRKFTENDFLENISKSCIVADTGALSFNLDTDTLDRLTVNTLIILIERDKAIRGKVFVGLESFKGIGFIVTTTTFMVALDMTDSDIVEFPRFLTHKIALQYSFLFSAEALLSGNCEFNHNPREQCFGFRCRQNCSTHCRVYRNTISIHTSWRFRKPERAFLRTEPTPHRLLSDPGPISKQQSDQR